MTAEERQHAIVEKVRAEGSVTIRELADALQVAAVTIRGDVRELTRRGVVARVHGAAVWPTRNDAASGTAGTPEGGHSATARTASAEAAAAAEASLPREGAAGFSIGMVVPHSSYYYPRVIAGAKAAAEALSVKLILSVSRNSVAEEQAMAAQMVDSGVDGLVLTTAKDPRTSMETASWLRGLSVPVVLAERRAGNDTGAVEYVATDHEYGAYQAVRHLAGRGRSRIALLQQDTLTAPMLQAGFDQALADLRLAPCLPVVPSILLEDDPEDLDDKCEQLVRAVKDGLVDAVLVHNDVMALPLVSRLRAAGVRLPEDLAIVTYDDELAELADPPLTGVAPPRRAVGSEAVELLVRRLQEPDRPVHQLRLQPVLNVRS